MIGIAPTTYLTAPPLEALWAPLAPEPQRLVDYGDHELTVYGLLKPGASPTAAIKQSAGDRDAARAGASAQSVRRRRERASR